MQNFKMLILSIQKKNRNKTVTFFEKIGITDYLVLVPKTVDREIAETYGDRLVWYDVETPKAYVDFCGTNIENGAAVGRVESVLWAHDNDCPAVVWDDDYGSAGNRLYEYKDAETLYGVLNDIYEMACSTGLDLGGYSGGSFPSTHRNIMQIFFVDKNTPLNKFRMILNEDVCSSIENWHHGVGTFGLGTILHSSNQTAEMEKWDGNTRFIYQSDRSWRKSYGAVLQDPAHVTIEPNKVNARGLWHHKVEWAKIMPKIIVEQQK